MLKRLNPVAKAVYGTVVAGSLVLPLAASGPAAAGVDEASQKVATTTSKLSADEKELAELRSLVTALRNALPEEREKRQELERRIAELEGKVARLEQQVQADRTTVTTAKSELEAVMQQFMGYLSDMQPVAEQSGWGHVERDRSVDYNRAPRDAHLRIGGTPYAKGLGTNTNSSVKYNLHGFAREFHAVVGIDDTYATKGNRHKPTTVFTVVGDGRQLARVQVTAGQAGVPIDVNVEGVQHLELVAVHTDTGRFNHADWALARVNR